MHSLSKQNIELAKITLNGDQLPWVDSAKHVGNVLERNNSFSKDLAMKRGDCIGRLHSILQEFHFANPLVKMQLFRIYTTSFYGSSLWDLFSGPCNKLYTSWNIAVRMAFEIPRESHRYFIEELSDCPHPQTMLAQRFQKFHETLGKTKKISVKYLSELSAGNKATVYGKNLCKSKSNLKYAPVPENDEWKVEAVKELLEIRWNVKEIENMPINTQELDDLLTELCTS